MNGLIKPTIILGASPNPSRYSFLATLRLEEAGHTVYPVGIKEGIIGNNSIITDKNCIKEVDTITIYIGAKKQAEWYNYIFQCNPKRIIMNPGTENPELWSMAREKGIECEEGCTLVMLATGQF